MGKATSKYEALHKEGFSFRALFPTINILLWKGERKKKTKKRTVAEGQLSFWKQKRKQTREAVSRTTPQIKFSLGKNSNNSGSHPSLW